MREPSTVDAAPRRVSPELALCAFLAIVLLIRTFVAGATHLTEDEAYYRQWSMHLDLGYFDHPPVVAWGVRAGISLFGDNSLGVRFFAIFASAVTNFLVYDLARVLGANSRTSLRAALWYTATLTVGLGGFLAIPDAPAGMFWATTMVCLARADRSNSPGWWVAAGVAGGLTCLSKYSGLFLAPGAFLWLVSSAQGRRRLLTPWPWLTLVIAGLIFGLNVEWNAAHNWVTFRKQFGRVTPPGFAPKHFAELLVLQSLLFGPVLTWFLVRGVRLGGSVIGGGVRFIVAMSLPFCGYLVLHSMHSIVQQHWPVPMFAGACVLAAVGAEASPTRLTQALKPWALSGLAISGVALLLLLTPLPSLGKKDPALPVEGWPAFSAKLEALAAPRGVGWLGAINYGTVAQLQTEAIGKLPTIQINERERYRTGEAAAQPDFSKPGLIVDLDRRVPLADLKTCFASVTDLGVVTRGADGGAKVSYRVVLVKDPTKDVLGAGCWTLTHLNEG